MNKEDILKSYPHPEETEDPASFLQLKIATRNIILKWIRSNLTKAKIYNNLDTSYRLKHMQEDETKVYVTNGQFKGAMLWQQFKPKHSERKNWIFQISNSRKAGRRPLNKTRCPGWC